MATLEDIRGWLRRAKPEHTHMMVVCDTYDFNDYPIFITKNEDVAEKMSEFDGRNMQQIMEVYNFSMDIEQQLNEWRAFHL